MAAIEREREAAQRARRGLSASTPRPRLSAIVRRAGMDLSAVDGGHRRRGRAHLSAGAAARRLPSTARIRALHAFRARVVDLRYQLRSVPRVAEALNAQAEALNDLREALGDFNDLHVLETFAAEHSGLSTQALEDLGAR